MTPKTSTDIRLVLVTVPSVEVGEQLSTQIVSGRLAACVNILPQITSIYEWNGELNKESEVLLLIKTTQERIAALQRCVIDNHPYEVPEFVVLDASQVSEAYGSWLRHMTSGGQVQ